MYHLNKLKYIRNFNNNIIYNLYESNVLLKADRYLNNRLFSSIFNFLSDNETEPIKHSQKKRINFQFNQIWAIVADINEYHHFVPWCQDSRITKILINDQIDEKNKIYKKILKNGKKKNDISRTYDDIIKNEYNNLPNIELNAFLTAGFSEFFETYESHVKLKPYKYVKSKAIDHDLFKYLNSEWYFYPVIKDGKLTNSCDIDFYVEFEWKSSIYQNISQVFLDQVIKKMVYSFENRCLEVYSNKK